MPTTPVSRRHLAFLVCAVALAGLVGGLGSASFQDRVADFQPLGFEVRPQGGGFLVTSVGDVGVGLVTGDEILVVRGETLAGLDELERSLRRAPETTVLVKRGDELVEARYVRPPLDLDVSYLVLATVGLLYLLIGLYTAWKDRHHEARLFFAWCLASAALYILSPPLQPLGTTDELVFLVDQLARTLLPALTLHLFLVFPATLLPASWTRRVVGLLYVPAAVLLAFHADQIFLGGRSTGGLVTAPTLDLVGRLELVLLVTFSAISVVALAVRLGGSQAWEPRRQLQWILLGMAGGYAPFLVLYVLPLVLGLSAPEWMTPLAVAPLALVPLAFSYAILKYKLWDLGVIVRDTLSSSLTVLIGIFGFSLVNLAIQRGLADDAGLVRNVLTFGAGLVVAGVLVPTRAAISTGLERLQYRGSMGIRRALGELGQELMTERDLERLSSTLLERLSEGLEEARTELFLTDGRLLRPVRPRPGVPRSLPFDFLGEALWGRSVLAISPAVLPGETLSPVEQLFTAGFRYAFPLTVHGHRVGVVVVGYKLDEKPLNSEDLDLARGLLNQAALALENSQLLEEVHSRLHEVTRLKERAQGILDSSPAGIVVLDDEDRVVSTNRAFLRLADIDGDEAGLVGTPLADHLPVRPLPRNGRGPVEISYCEASGRERYLQLSVAVYPQADGARQRVLVVQDVTERMELENALKEKEHMASLGMLAAGVAHEVNTPITGISSYAQMLLAEIPEGDPHRDILKKMERQTFRAAQIVNNLLEFSRHRRQTPGQVDLVSVVEECNQLLADRAADARVEVEIDLPASAYRPIVSGHAPELEQVVTNLMVNAIDAMAAAGGRLRLRVEGTQDLVRLEVSDTGPGVPAERLERIFQPFFSSKLGRGGTGLGLAITHNVVLRHGGEIRAENHTDGPGCTFTVELPRLPKSREPADGSGGAESPIH